jgi:Excalibur calcium-binding domain
MNTHGRNSRRGVHVQEIDSLRGLGAGLVAVVVSMSSFAWSGKVIDIQDGVAASRPAGKVPTSAGNGISLKCSAKRTCGEMSSCEEAKFYFEHCGLSRLDGDHDGVPCEKICR